MKEVVDYTVLFAGIAAIIAAAHYAETAYGVNWWLTAVPLGAVAFPLMDMFFRRRA